MVYPLEKIHVAEKIGTLLKATSTPNGDRRESDLVWNVHRLTENGQNFRRKQGMDSNGV